MGHFLPKASTWSICNTGTSSWNSGMNTLPLFGFDPSLLFLSSQNSPSSMTVFKHVISNHTIILFTCPSYEFHLLCCNSREGLLILCQLSFSELFKFLKLWIIVNKNQSWFLFLYYSAVSQEEMVKKMHDKCMGGQF